MDRCVATNLTNFMLSTKCHGIFVTGNSSLASLGWGVVRDLNDKVSTRLGPTPIIGVLGKHVGLWRGKLHDLTCEGGWSLAPRASKCRNECAISALEDSLR